MKNHRKPLIITLCCVLAVALAAAGVWFFWLKDYLSLQNASPAYVTSVSSILGMENGSTPRYSGIVEPQETFKIEKDQSKTVAEVLVKVGDQVHPGDVLFRYDTQELQFSLREADIALEGIANQISTLQAQITSLKAEQKKAQKDDQISYTIQIQSAENQINQLKYDSDLKKAEKDKLQNDLSNTDVLCEVEGVVKEVNSTPATDPSGQQAAFISILSSGEYRIKGTVSELNRDSIVEGQAVVVHSRVNSDQTWKGVVETVDREPAKDQNNGAVFYPGMDTGDQSSKYNFYVTLDSLDGLILGQHVYIEPDQGEQSQKTGLWLPAVYVAHDESGSYVWAKGEDEKLEKRLITLGDYDADTDTYEIKDGVTKYDFIAYPSDTLRPGIPTTTDNTYQDPVADGTDIPGGMGSFNGLDDPNGLNDPNAIPEGSLDGSLDGAMDGDGLNGTDDSWDTGDGENLDGDASGAFAEGGLEMIPPTLDEGGAVE